MTILVVLVVLLINLMVSFGLIGMIYLLALLPIKEELKSLKAIAKQPLPMATYVPPVTLMKPENILPSMDDIPLESFWGDNEEDNKTTPEDVEDAIAERSHNSYNSPRTTSAQQLGSLKM